MTSRQKLYEFGLPLGDGVTRAKLGGGVVCGGGGDSESSQQSNTYDNRTAVQDGVGLSSSSGNWIDASSTSKYEATTNYSSNTSTDISVMDGGLIGRGLDTVDAAFKGMLSNNSNTIDGALNSININNATNSDNFTKLLDTAGDWFSQGQGLIGQTQKSVADAYAQAQTEAKGTIDNKTIMVIAVAAVAGLAFVNKAK
ncbi:hypothetical protein KUF54_07150 [Comamonas sp. Y33R10-2]|uniref:hypothetical protein n=1 Tax=Comamonas sp. Y33R10-2 TaxID=2853257 RepID=UPI001C5CBB20|nr:hypothetical protein [Comamonas sp. Y33R10-2]QXZ10963.1 hypothetical protein KUF54_07150 [Comamonas sp. Y33R10-2]